MSGDLDEFQGSWYLPEYEQEQVRGTLKFTPEDGASLELEGSFDGPLPNKGEDWRQGEE